MNRNPGIQLPFKLNAQNVQTSQTAYFCDIVESLGDKG